MWSPALVTCESSGPGHPSSNAIFERSSARVARIMARRGPAAADEKDAAGVVVLFETLQVVLRRKSACRYGVWGAGVSMQNWRTIVYIVIIS